MGAPWLRLARGLFGCAALVAACGWLSSCQRPARSPAPLRIAHEGELASLDPIAATDLIAKSVLANLYDALLDVDQEMRPIPALALSWSTPTERTWIVQLRPGVRTHDGGLLSADDVKFSLERAAGNPSSALRERLTTIAQVEVLDESQIRIRTREPDPVLLHRLADVFIAPRARSSGLARHPVGTGRYRFVARHGDALDVEAFAEHWRGAPPVTRVRFLTVKPGEATVTALRGGAVDVLRFVPEALFHRVATLPRVRIMSRHGLRVLYLWMRSDPRSSPTNPFADRRVRQALSMAIDRPALVGRMGGRAEPMTQYIPAGVFGHVPGSSWLRYDPEAARRLLREAGYGAGLQTTLTHVAGGEAVVDILVGMLDNVGVHVRAEPREWPEMLSDWRSGRLPFFLGSWSFSSGQASMFLKECISTRDPNVSSAWNPGYSNRKLDDLIRENFATFGGPNRLDQFQRITEQMADEMPLIPLFNRHDLYAVRATVKWVPRLDGRLLAAEMDREER